MLIEHEVGFGRVDMDVDREARVIRDVALAGSSSRNGYRYAADALQAAVPLYEGKPVFLDHGSRPGRPRERSARDLAGHVRDVRFVGGRLRGDVVTLETEAGRTLLALAEGDFEGVGMSHVVLADRGLDGETVTAIRDVVSVDAVVFPATTRTFREGVSWGLREDGHEADSAAEPVGIDAVTAALGATLPGPLVGVGVEAASVVGVFPREVLVRVEVAATTDVVSVSGDTDAIGGGDGGESPSGADREVRHYLLPWRFESGAEGPRAVLGAVEVEELEPVERDVVVTPGWAEVLGVGEPGAEGLPVGDPAAVAAERDRLSAELSRVRREALRARRVETLLERSGLPGSAVTEAFRASLAALPTEGARVRAIADRRAVLEGARRGGAVSVGRSGAAGEEAIGRSIVAAVTGGLGGGRGRSE